jgi:hypothetical protein
MSNVIGFLEAVGQDSELRHGDSEQLTRAAARAGIVLDSLAGNLAELLEKHPIVCCSLERPDDDEDEKEPGKEDDEVRAIRAA